jgi:hypothetical protein
LKKYVEVTAHHNAQGFVRPLILWWDDGRKYEIDRVLDVRRAASLKAGGIGIRYTCRILGKERYLYLDEDKWYVNVPDDFAH